MKSVVVMTAAVKGLNVPRVLAQSSNCPFVCGRKKKWPGSFGSGQSTNTADKVASRIRFSAQDFLFEHASWLVVSR